MSRLSPNSRFFKLLDEPRCREVAERITSMLETHVPQDSREWMALLADAKITDPLQYPPDVQAAFREMLERGLDPIKIPNYREDFPRLGLIAYHFYNKSELSPDSARAVIAICAHIDLRRVGIRRGQPDFDPQAANVPRYRTGRMATPSVAVDACLMTPPPAPPPAQPSGAAGPAIAFRPPSAPAAASPPASGSPAAAPPASVSGHAQTPATSGSPAAATPASARSAVSSPAASPRSSGTPGSCAVSDPSSGRAHRWVRRAGFLVGVSLVIFPLEIVRFLQPNLIPDQIRAFVRRVFPAAGARSSVSAQRDGDQGMELPVVVAEEKEKSTCVCPAPPACPAASPAACELPPSLASAAFISGTPPSPAARRESHAERDSAKKEEPSQLPTSILLQATIEPLPASFADTELFAQLVPDEPRDLDTESPLSQEIRQARIELVNVLNSHWNELRELVLCAIAIRERKVSGEEWEARVKQFIALRARHPGLEVLMAGELDFMNAVKRHLRIRTASEFHNLRNLLEQWREWKERREMEKRNIFDSPKPPEPPDPPVPSPPVPSPMVKKFEWD